jgi:hypothetical protein
MRISQRCCDEIYEDDEVGEKGFMDCVWVA